MRSFYQQCFGLQSPSTAEDYCVLESGAWTLSLVVVPDDIAATIHVSEAPRRWDDAPVKLAFDVPDIDDFRSIVAGLGGKVDPMNTQWDFRGL
jgi:hypothetical protein